MNKIIFFSFFLLLIFSIRAAETCNNSQRTIICETQRLKIGLITLDDAQDLVPVLGDKDVMEQGLSGPLSFDQIKEYIQVKILKTQQERGWSRYAVIKKDDGVLIGYCGLSVQTIGDGKEYAELGYRFAKQYWGNGYATEAASAVRDYARDVLGLDELISIIHWTNPRSIRVAEKTGLPFWQMGKYHGHSVNVYRIAFDQ